MQQPKIGEIGAQEQFDCSGAGDKFEARLLQQLWSERFPVGQRANPSPDLPYVSVGRGYRRIAPRRQARAEQPAELPLAAVFLLARTAVEIYLHYELCPLAPLRE